MGEWEGPASPSSFEDFLRFLSNFLCRYVQVKGSQRYFMAQIRPNTASTEFLDLLLKPGISLFQVLLFCGELSWVDSHHLL